MSPELQGPRSDGGYNLAIQQQDLILVATNRCNFSCDHCLRGKKTRDDIDIAALENFLVGAKDFGFSYVRITGGEAGLHKNFYGLCEMIVRNGYDFNFITNGYDTSLYDDVIRDFKGNIGVVATSIDGAIAATHERYRREGSFDRAVAAISKFKREDKIGKVSVNFFADKFTQSEAEGVLRVVKDAGGDAVWVGGYLPDSYGRAESELSGAEKISLMDRLIPVAEEIGIELSFAVTFLPFRRGAMCMNVTRPQINVLPTGEVSFCCNFPGKGVVVGDLRSQSFDTIRQSVREAAAVVFREKHRIKKGKLAPPKMCDGATDCDFCYSLLSSQIKYYGG